MLKLENPMHDYVILPLVFRLILVKVGEIARAAAIFEVDEIVVYEDQTVSRKGQGGVRDDSVNSGGGGGGDGSSGGGGDKNNPNVFMARLLQVRGALESFMPARRPCNREDG